MCFRNSTNLLIQGSPLKIAVLGYRCDLPFRDGMAKISEQLTLSG